ncbi:ATP-binding protein [Fidelibacter multiformis]|uniref:sensor histidine kinase n=1 Tax=Fidelibacter multiformis TaxID=3377529 RepID=UPI0037DC0F00
MNSIFYRVFSRYAFIILILSVVIFLFSFTIIRTNHINTLSSSLENLAISLEDRVLELIRQKDYSQLDAFVKEKGKHINARITVIRKDGVVLADSEADPAVMENHRDRPEIMESITGRIGRSVRFSTTVQTEMLYIAMPLLQNSDITAVLRLSLFLEDINTLLATLRNRFLMITLIFIAVAMVLAFYFARDLSKPIKELVSTSRRIAEETLDITYQDNPQNEITFLANNFDEMAAQITRLFAKTNRQKEELRAVISAIQEAVVVLNPEGKISLYNNSFASLAKRNNLKHVPIEDVLPDKFTTLLRHVNQENRYYTREIELDGQIYLCSLNCLKTRKEIVVLLHNVTELKNLRQMKRDFIANVSHELRTPLTSIKGFIETLLEDENPETTRYLNIIKRNTDRLIHIVEDLLILSEMEKRDFTLKIDTLNPVHLIENVSSIFKQKMEAKGLELILNLPDHLPSLEADEFKLEQLFVNLIDNAVKYTETGSITISARADETSIYFSIADTGIGIPEDDLNRIFERFYVVDKSRSRRVGGTGLGLSIVKHIVLLHQGYISVNSEKKKGTEFLITLPLRHTTLLT